MIRLDELKRSPAEVRSLERDYLYKDIRFDLELTRFVKRDLYADPQPQDLSDITDARAVVNAVKNILTTAPGEKLLNPTFGLDLRFYLFEPINPSTSYFIAKDIYSNLGIQEPRINLENVSVTGNLEQHQYDIDIVFSIPLLELYNLSLRTTLNTDGYVVI